MTLINTNLLKRLVHKNMKLALAVVKVENTKERNINKILKNVEDAALKGSDIIVFSETALTGLINEDIPEKDLKLGVTIPGKETGVLCEFAKKHEIYIAIGLFEKYGSSLYDSAILINKKGEIAIKYRRISRGWRGPKSDSAIYKEGIEIPHYDSEYGRLCVLICGDFFDDLLLKRVKELKADYLLLPYARSFIDCSFDNEKWEKEELPAYCGQAKKADAVVIGVNSLDNEYFGGGFILSKAGKIILSFDLGIEEMITKEMACLL
ncbi:TPA: hypothetical protein DCW38_01935 [candidate division WOR-3 bacterium]|uniref:CN hydrolase domain-containing protein n=1 Tax=candidate division WOR-3 bacterium TaxID=2052148 RepID=A0A350H8Q9_UNCW3|nr:hypothetical protein [candidate division WOR-3 bacterium]